MAIGVQDGEAGEGRIEALEAENARLRAALARAGSGEGEEGFRAIADSIDQMIWSTRPDGHHDYFNQRWYDFTGVPPGSTDGEEWNGMFHPDDRERAWAVWRDCLASGEPYEIEYRLRHRSGDYRWVLGRARPVRGADARILRWYGTCTDIHDFKTIEDALRDSQAMLAAFLDNSPDALFVKDSEGRYVAANAGFLRSAARPAEAVIGKTDRDLFLPEAAAAFAAEDREIRESGRAKQFEETFEYGGRRVTFLTRKFPFPGGRVGGIGTNITDRKEAEEALRESEARLRALTDNLPMAMVYQVLTPRDVSERRYVYISANCEALTGVPADEAVRNPAALAGIIGEDSFADVFAAERRAAETLQPLDVELTGRRRDGSVMKSRVISRPRLLDDGKLLWDGILIDITERKLAQEEAERTAALVRAIGDATLDLIYAKDRDCRLIYANAATAAMLGLSPEEAVGRDNFDITRTEEEGSALTQNDRRVLETGRQEVVEEVFTSADGTTRIFRSAKTPMRDGEGNVIGLAGVSSDITEHKAAEEALRESEERLRVALSAGSLGAWSWDAASDIVSLSDEAAALFGLKPGPLATWSELARLVLPDDAGRATEAIARSVETRSDYNLEYRIVRPDGGQLWVNTVARPIYAEDGSLAGMIGAVGDVSARREAEAKLRELNETLEQRVAEEIDRRGEAEEALRQAQKMETLGQLTGGVAHDFNNLLQIVRGNLEIIGRNLPDDSELLRRATTNALRGADRAAVLTQRLLAFSRRQPLAPKPIDLNTLVASMSELLHRTLGETIEIETVLASGLWRTEADPNQLENAILNLAVNARDAMPEGGRLSIETANGSLEREDLAAGDYVVVRVADTGVGMEAGTVERVFEPFFTTKDVGKGTGLGLSMVYGFVRQSGGHVEIDSAPGAGTSVRIFLPRHAGASAVAEIGEVQSVAPEGSRGETILVCEDDDDVRAYSIEVLRELGYRVLEARDGPAALRLLEGSGGDVDLLFTDVVLPGGMTGAAVAEEARKLRPDLPVLFTTGYARNAIDHDGRLDPGVELIQKPFTANDLAARLRALLDAASPVP